MNSFAKLSELLDPAQRRAAIVLFCLMLIGMVLETLGIGVAIPALALMMEGDVAARYPVLKPALAAFGHLTHAELIVGGMLTLVGVYAVKAFFLAFLAWQQFQFAFGLQASLSQRLFALYLRQPYTFHLQRNSAQLILTVTNEVGHLMQAVMAGALVLTETLVLTGVITLVLLVEPLGALLSLATLGLASYGFHYFTKGSILRWGEARLFHDGQRLQHVQQGLGGAKDVKLLGREDDFLAQYAFHNVSSMHSSKRMNLVQALPRLWLELLAVIGLAAMVLTMLAQGKPVESLIPTLGLFVAAAFRLMPSITRIIGAHQSLSFFSPVTNTLYAELRHLDDTQAPSRTGGMLFKQNLQLKNIGYTYSGMPTAALAAINLSIPRGTSVGFVGASGAGKSTLVDVILGLLTPTQGHITVDGIDIQTSLRDWQDQIGYVPQTIFLTDDTLRRNVAFGLAPDEIDEQAVQAAIKAAQLQDFIAGLPEGLDTMVGERGIRLSGGQRQRIGIARALYHDPPVLVLDEATSALDIATEQDVMQGVSQLHGNKTILIVAHRLSTIAQCDRLYRLEGGRVVDQGAFAEVINQ